MWHRESDGLIVPVKAGNAAGGKEAHMGARSEETSTVLRNGEPVETKLHRIAEKARKEPSFSSPVCFT